MEDNGIGYKELLVAGSNKRYRKICGEYNMCQRMKDRMEALAEKLKLSEVSEKL